MYNVFRYLQVLTIFIVDFQCVADADTAIAKITSEYQSSGKHAVVTADDTDVLCILIHLWKKPANTSEP